MSSKTSTATRIASCGFGVASTAMLFVSDYDYIIHANPGAEHEWTRALQGFARQYFDEKMVEVSNSIPEELRGFFIHPRFRRCTHRFKLVPMRQHWRSVGLRRYVVLIGYSYEERSRVRTSDVGYIEFEYPLIEQRLTRDDCLTILRKYFPFRILKSGCFDCFSSKQTEQSFPLERYLYAVKQ